METYIAYFHIFVNIPIYLYVLVCFSAAINTMIKRNLGGKSLFATDYSTLLRKAKAGIWSQQLKQRLCMDDVTDLLLLACSVTVSVEFKTTDPSVAPFTVDQTLSSIINRENLPQACPLASLGEAISQQKFPLPKLLQFVSSRKKLTSTLYVIIYVFM